MTPTHPNASRSTALMLLLMVAVPALAQDWMQWPPRAGSTAIAPVEGRSGSSKVDLVLERNGDHIDVLVDNPLAGPVQAVVTLDRNGRQEETAAVVSPGNRSRLVQLPIGQAINVQLQAIPGDPALQPRPFDYVLPVPAQGLRIDQADGGAHSHNDDENRHAVDFALPMGTMVSAARDGIVMDLDNDEPDNTGANSNRRARANFVRVLHVDGSMALYAHLQRGSIPLHRGDRVAIGQRIGSVGNSGWSTAPHLHFAVQVNGDRRLQSIPVRILAPQGVLKLPN
ncbi:M23 family metallopeptidase [Solilutibacter silvestris]|uniref:Metalloendopeptidase-related protein n=1 Tax=Solilutibacter silvestris TaxID=1645665 RepID=A0A2K1PXB9_9GAMM|nr:M23 family metallopeptidase [Lysobacter silvestris]PNS07429.1 metalloendopeptidase-related protein [Lysobacter silvestris]